MTYWELNMTWLQKTNKRLLYLSMLLLTLLFVSTPLCLCHTPFGIGEKASWRCSEAVSSTASRLPLQKSHCGGWWEKNRNSRRERVSAEGGGGNLCEALSIFAGKFPPPLEKSKGTENFFFAYLSKFSNAFFFNAKSSSLNQLIMLLFFFLGWG